MKSLYYFRARWYDPVVGRWLSKDPIGIAGGLNQYVFCSNNPVNFVDPLGLMNWAQAGAGLGMIGSGASLLAGTIAEDVYTGGIGIIDDPATIAAGSTLVWGGLEMLRNAGERGRTAKPEGTANPWKHRKPYPGDPTKMLEKDPHTGKWKIKPKPPNAPWTVIPPVPWDKNNDGGPCENK